MPGALWCDAAAFQTALQHGQADIAAALWRGELLPGFYDEWITDERLRLVALYDRLRDRLNDRPGDGPGERVPLAPRPAPVPAASASRLPHYLTRLIGADQAGARLLALVATQRLVTVLGPGGAGKRRLAVEAAHLAVVPVGEPRLRFDSAAFVSLVDAVDPLTLFDRLLQALRLGGGGPPQEQIVQALAGRRVLLVRDNAEQLDDAAAAALAALAASLPAVLLLVDRVRAHHSDFHVDAPRQAPLVALVRWLDGLPLALELAATQMRTLGPKALPAPLQQARAADGGGALDLLARRGRRSGIDPRHASMRAVVDGSWRLLDAPQRAMLRALSLLPAGAPAALAAGLDDGLAAGCHALASTRHQEAGRPDDARRHGARAAAPGRLPFCGAGNAGDGARPRGAPVLAARPRRRERTRTDRAGAAHRPCRRAPEQLGRAAQPAGASVLGGRPRPAARHRAVGTGVGAVVALRQPPSGQRRPLQPGHQPHEGRAICRIAGRVCCSCAGRADAAGLGPDRRCARRAWQRLAGPAPLVRGGGRPA